MNALWTSSLRLRADVVIEKGEESKSNQRRISPGSTEWWMVEEEEEKKKIKFWTKATSKNTERASPSSIKVSVSCGDNDAQTMIRIISEIQKRSHSLSQKSGRRRKRRGRCFCDPSLESCSLFFLVHAQRKTQDKNISLRGNYASYQCPTLSRKIASFIEIR